MGYATTTTGYRGIVSAHNGVQCLGINVTKSLDSNGNTILEVRSPVVARTTETVKEWVGLSYNTATGNGPADSGGRGAGLFVPWAVIDTSGANPFVSYERIVSKKCDGGNGGLWSVLVTERTSVLV